MASKIFSYIFLLGALLCSSCSEDEELLLQKEKQDQKIAAMEQQLVHVMEELRNKPADVSADISATKERLIQLEGKISKLEDELMVIRGEKITIEQVCEEYREKHPIR